MVHIAITGASGLIGSHATQYALSQGHTITAIDIAPLPEHLVLPEGSIFCQVDCTDFRAVEDALRKIPCDGVIHLSAIANPRVSQWDMSCLLEADTDRAAFPTSPRCPCAQITDRRRPQVNRPNHSRRTETQLLPFTGQHTTSTYRRATTLCEPQQTLESRG